MEHRFLAVHYQLHSVKDGEQTLEEQTIREQPFQFISGFGVALEALEQHVLPLEKGTEFEFTLTPDEAFGEYNPEGVHTLGRDFFNVNGKFDAQYIYPGAIIQLVDGEENRFPARVIKVEPEGVTELFQSHDKTWLDKELLLMDEQIKVVSWDGIYF